MIDSFIPDDFLDSQWFSAGDGLYIFGIKEGSKITRKHALTKRRPDGAWDWAIAGTNFTGREPSNELATAKVNSVYLSAMQMREALS